jgi:hypothetical protein
VESRPNHRAVAQLLAERCERLFTELVPDAKPSRNDLRGHGPDGGIWAIVCRGPKRGVFANWSDENQKGDCLELVHWALFRGEYGRRESYRWALTYLGLDDAAAADLSGELRRGRERAEAVAAERGAQAEADRVRRQTHAKGVYLHATEPYALAPQIADYLTIGRGLPIGDLPSSPGNLRFGFKRYNAEHPAVPAIVAAIVHPISRQHRATHVTYLTERGGHYHNTELRPKRLVFGNKKGGVIPLLRGASKQREIPDNETLLIGEGIENTLAAALIAPEIHNIPPEPRVWAAVDIGNLAAIELPEAIASVILVDDNDNERFGAWRAALERGWLEEGRSVQRLRPPKGFKDFNDYVARLAAREHAGA